MLLINKRKKLDQNPWLERRPSSSKSQKCLISLFIYKTYQVYVYLIHKLCACISIQFGKGMCKRHDLATCVEKDEYAAHAHRGRKQSEKYTQVGHGHELRH